MKFIMVDIGSTFIKAGLFDVGLKKQIEKTKYPTPPRKANHDSSYYENDAMEVVGIVKGIIHDCCRNIRIQLESCFLPSSMDVLSAIRNLKGILIFHGRIPGA